MSVLILSILYTCLYTAGDYAPKTIDCFTRPGSVQLVHVDEVQAEKDLEAIHHLEPLGLFDFSVICPTPPIIGAVVVVRFLTHSLTHQ